MKLLAISSLLLASSAFVSAVPAPAPVGEGLIDLASWSAQKVADQFTAVEDVKDTAVEDGGMVAMGGWSWTDCGALRLSSCLVCRIAIRH
jgi:hypothetical protein